MRLVAALVVVYVVWGSTYLAIAVADRTLPPFLMLSGRLLLSRAVLCLGGLARGIAWAEQRVASGTVALLVASVPLFVALLDRVCFGERIAAGAWLGIAVGLV